MSDQISRADAIKAVEQEYRIDRGYMVDDYTYGFNQAIHYVSDIILPDLPSAETHEIRTETHACVKETHDTDLISRADAIEAVRKELVCDGRHETHDKTCRFIADVLLSALPSADAVPQSEQYKKGFEDAKMAFELEYARESENMRKRNAQLEVMLNAQKEISADTVQGRMAYKSGELFLTLNNAVEVAVNQFDVDPFIARQELEQKCYIPCSDYEKGFYDGLAKGRDAIINVMEGGVDE